MLNFVALPYYLAIFSFINFYERCLFYDVLIIFSNFFPHLGIAYLKNGYLISRFAFSIFDIIICLRMFYLQLCFLFLYLVFIYKMVDLLASQFKNLNFYLDLQNRYAFFILTSMIIFMLILLH